MTVTESWTAIERRSQKLNLPEKNPGVREARRAHMQASLDAELSSQSRNQRGQYATPADLACEIAAHARSLLPRASPIEFLEPAIGTGAFFSALSKTFDADRIHRATGFEIDPHYGLPSADLWGGTQFEVKLGDFTAQAPPERKYNLLLTNPPYVRHHHIGPDKKRLQLSSQAVLGERPSGLTGLYCHFIYLSFPWLSEGALSAWLIPTEGLEVGYGQTLRRFLLNRVTLLRIHRYDAADEKFADAMVSSCVVWFRKSPPPPDHKVEMSFGGSHANPSRRVFIPADRLSDAKKWNEPSLRRAHEGIPAPRDPRLKDAFEIRRGIVTGANRFFILTPEEAEALALPRECLRPILPGPRHLSGSIIEADPDSNPVVDKPLLLLDCRLSPDEVRARHPQLWRYLEGGSQTAATSYICRSRRVWYRQEDRAPAPYLCQYMGRRRRDGQLGRFYLNLSRATASNNLMMLYPKPWLAGLITGRRRAEEVLSLLQSIDVEDLRENGRLYGGGMHKFEPGDLADLPLPGLEAWAQSRRDQPSPSGEKGWEQP
jgi:hypothetical protein